MRRALRRAFSEHEVLTLRDMRPGDICEEFLSEALALKFLRELARDGYNMRVLRAILVEGLFRPDLSGLDDYETLRQLAWQLVSGKIRITTARLRTGVGGEKPPAEKEEPATNRSRLHHSLLVAQVPMLGRRFIASTLTLTRRKPTQSYSALVPLYSENT